MNRIRRLMVALAGTALLLVWVPGSAQADPSINEHNCAGFVVSLFAAPGFGAGVAAAADAQQVDNFGLANCGQDNRNNP